MSLIQRLDMISSLVVILIVTFLVGLGSFLIKPRDIRWSIHLRRPKWLVFEPAIPLIWTIVFVCGAVSATIIWEKDPGSLKTWLLMGWYVILEIVTVAYIPATLRLKSLKVGTLLGGIGVALGVILTLFVWPISGTAALLLLPYAIWSPVGTVTTKEMIDLNPDAA